MLSVILLSIGMSIDAIGIGISFGVRKIRLGISAGIIISFMGLTIISLAVMFGSALQCFLPDNIGDAFGSLILIAMGIWILIQSREKADSTQNRTVKILREPYEGDIDKSGNIEPKEAVFLGLALSLDSIGICVGAGGSLKFAYILPAAAILIQVLFLLIGIILGEHIGSKFNTKLCTICSGTIIIALGLINLTGCF